MALLDIEVLRSKSSDLIVQTLPDGSTAIFEVSTKNVYSLNASAAAAWEACASANTLSQIAATMSRKLDVPVTEDLAHEALSELVAVGLVKLNPGESLGTSRRDMLRKVAGVALPAVLVLTGAQQRAHAQGAGSPPVVTTSPGGGSTTPPPSTTSPFLTTTVGICRNNTVGVVKGVRQPDLSVLPLAGAVFELRTAGGSLVATLPPTGADGRASVTSNPAPPPPGVPLVVNPGSYQLVEKSAPGGPYQPRGPIFFTVPASCDDRWFDVTNIPL